MIRGFWRGMVTKMGCEIWDFGFMIVCDGEGERGGAFGGELVLGVETN